MNIIRSRKNKILALVGLIAWLAPLSVLADNIYVSNSSLGTVYVIDSTDNSLTTTLTGLSRPAGLAVSPDSTRLYVLLRGGACNQQGVAIE